MVGEGCYTMIPQVLVTAAAFFQLLCPALRVLSVLVTSFDTIFILERNFTLFIYSTFFILS